MLDPGDIPTREVAVERSAVLKHAVRGGQARDDPAGDVAVEVRGRVLVKQEVHDLDPRHVPGRHVPVEVGHLIGSR